MNDGTITSNTNAYTGSNVDYLTRSGGGVYVYNGTFTMNGGEIYGNSVTNQYNGIGANNRFKNYAYGGGGYVTGANSTFTINGGTIRNNTITAQNTSDNDTNASGGGVYMTGGTFTINEGKISSNTATAPNGGSS
jgi:hypothetical protein